MFPVHITVPGSFQSLLLTEVVKSSESRQLLRHLSTHKMAPLKCSIRTMFTPGFGQVVKPDKHIHTVLTELTLKAISIMMTNRARAALLRVTEQWSQQHQVQLDCETAVAGFQAVLIRARNDLSTWPTVVMDWTISEKIDAIYHGVRADVTSDNQPFSLKAEYIRLNGVVCHSVTIFTMTSFGQFANRSEYVAYTLSCTRYDSTQSRAVYSQIRAYLDLLP